MIRGCRFFILILGAWLGMSVLVDFISMPAVFRNVSSRVEAGNIGMTIFSRFNLIEIFFSLGLIISAYFFRVKVVWKKLLSVSLLFLLSLSCFYNFSLTPSIKEVNKERAELIEGTLDYQKLEKEHEFYHQLYVRLDGLKLLILLTLIGSTLRGRDELCEGSKQ